MQRKSIQYKSKIVFERVTMPGNFKRIPKLFQEDEACFLYMARGAFKFRTPTNIFEINEGEAILAKCGNYFIEQISTEASIDTLSVFGVYFYPGMVKEFFETDISLKKFGNNFDVDKLKVEPLMKTFIDSINYLLDNPQLADENLISNKLKELILLLGKTEKSIHDFIHSLFVPFEYDFKEIIQKNLYANLSLSELANLCNCSLATFKRKFKQQYELSPAKYFLQQKLEKATQLLQLQTMPIAEVAYACGFENAPYFNKAFKKQFAKSPTEYRMSQIEKKLSL